MAHLLIYFNASIAVIALGIATYYLFFHKKSTKPVPTIDDRRDEVGELSPDQKRIYDQAEELAAKGYVQSAAKMMESLGVFRRTVDLLEEHGYIEDATNVLLRIHAPHRAAAIYEKHGYWLEAIDCHKISRKYSTAAEIYEKNIADFASAAYHYELADDLISAARCHEQCGNIREAIECHTQGRNWDKAIKLSQSLFDQLAPEQFHPRDEELKVLEKALIKKNIVDPNFLKVLSRENRLHQVVFADLAHSRIDRARKCIPYLSENATSTLIGMCVKKNIGERLWKAFAFLGDLENAGNTLESLGLREEACRFYEQNNMFERAVNMYEANDPKSKEILESMLSRLEANGSRTNTGSKSTPVDFVSYKQRRAFNNASVVKLLTLNEKDALWDLGVISSYKQSEFVVQSKQDSETSLNVILEGEVVSRSDIPQIGGPLKESNAIESGNVISGQSYSSNYAAKEDCSIWQISMVKLNEFYEAHKGTKRKMLQTSFASAYSDQQAI